MAAAAGNVPQRGVLTFPIQFHCPILEGETRYDVFKTPDGQKYVRIYLDRLSDSEFKNASIEVANIAVGVFDLQFGGVYRDSHIDNQMALERVPSEASFSEFDQMMGQYRYLHARASRSGARVSPDANPTLFSYEAGKGVVDRVKAAYRAYIKPIFEGPKAGEEPQERIIPREIRPSLFTSTGGSSV